MMTNPNQLSLFNGASLAGNVAPSEGDLRIASCRESLVKLYQATHAENGKNKIGKFILAYNGGAFPDILEAVGTISRATLYGWTRNYREGGVDALIPLYRCRRPKVSRAEDRCLRELLLDHIKIGQAIFITKYFLKRRGTESPSSPVTLRRWAKRILDKK